MGWLAPVGVPSPDGKLMAFSSWQALVELDPVKSFSSQGIRTGDALGVPSIYIHSLLDGQDTLLADGAFSLAWRSDNVVAYFEGLEREYRANERYLGRIMVRSSPSASPLPWTAEPDRYIAIAWAGDALLAYRELEGEQLDLLVLDGPYRSRVLAIGGTLVAVSPDGTKVLVNMPGPNPEAALLDVGSGLRLATLELGRLRVGGSNLSLQYLGNGGSWVKDLVVAESDLGIVIVSVRDTVMEVSRILPLIPRPFRMGIHEPQFIGDTGTRFVGWAPIPGKGGQAKNRLYVYVDCDLMSSVCIEGAARTERTFYEVYNPSRPTGGEM
jgi:hypothetical protein